MADGITFTSAQRALIEASGSTYVEACPGAGKTQCIVERFMRRATETRRRGVGLISFTNAVVEEARSRCAGQTELLTSPNFVGTIDSFINRLLVGPVLNSERRRVHVFRSSWKHVAGSVVTARNVPASAQLDWFVFTLDGQATLDVSRVPPEARSLLRSLERWKVTKLQDAAGQQWRRNIERGVLDANAARLYLVKYLQADSSRAHLLDLMSSRFHEVIVDEVQDCSREDAALLQLLIDAEVPLILVGDPQQAIYGFRGGGATGLARVIATITPGTRLDGNFRSSPAICTAVDSFRSSTLKDEAVGRRRNVAHPVRLLRYDQPSKARSQIAAALTEHDLKQDDLVVLAHASTTARACAGAGNGGGAAGTSRLVALAVVIHVIHDEAASARARTDALTGLESLLHQTTPDELQSLAFNEYLDTIGVSPRAYREQSLRLAMSAPPPYGDKPSVFKDAITAGMTAQKKVEWGSTVLRTPNGDRWASRPSTNEGADSHSTIHGFKGLQAAAVALIIPKRIAGMPANEDGLSQWAAGQAGDARNVLYVGASRAEQLLIIAAHESVYHEVKANLDRDNVTYR